MPTYVSKIHLPKRERFDAYIDKIYESGWVTNGGPLVRELELALEDYLDVENLLVVANGTTALQISYMTLGISGDVLTTPFSYVSTTSSLVEQRLNPVFVDIDPTTLNMNPEKILQHVTNKTSALLPVHVFGNTCDIDVFEKKAADIGCKLIFDASHSFAATYKGKSVLSFGDVSTLSFHATKFFHTIEGGAIVFKNKDDLEKARLIRGYGIDGPDRVSCLGINGKINEFQAAMGMCVLEEIDEIREEREIAYDYYVDRLKDLVSLQQLNPDAVSNKSYFPAVFDTPEQMDAVRSALAKKEIFPRQYFNPSLDTLPYVTCRDPMTNSHDVISRILVLPLHSNVQAEVCDVIEQVLRGEKA